MKKKIGLLIGVLCIFVFAGALFAGGNIFVVTQPSASTTYTVLASGTSTFPVLDLNDVKGYGPVTGACTFQINSWAIPTGASSGATTNWYYRQSSLNTTAGWAGAQQIPIVTGLAHSGTTLYQWALDLDLQKYLRVECVSGASNATISINLTFQAPGGKTQ